MDGQDINGWGEWRRHLLLEVEALRKGFEEIKDDVAEMKTEIALLKYKYSVFGLLGGAVAFVIVKLMKL